MLTRDDVAWGQGRTPPTLDPGGSASSGAFAYQNSEDALRADPFAPVPAVVRWHLRRRDVDWALQLAREELAERPRDIILQLLRAESLWHADRLAALERACRQMLTRLPRLLKPRLLLGYVLCAD